MVRLSCEFDGNIGPTPKRQGVCTAVQAPLRLLHNVGSRMFPRLSLNSAHSSVCLPTLTFVVPTLDFIRGCRRAYTFRSLAHIFRAGTD